MQWNKPWGLGVLVTMPSSFLSTNSPSVKLISLRIDSSGFDDAVKDKINHFDLILHLQMGSQKYVDTTSQKIDIISGILSKQLIEGKINSIRLHA